MPNDDDRINIGNLRSCLDKIQESLTAINNRLDTFEAPNDGKYYARGNGFWNAISSTNVIKTYTTKYKIQNSSGEQIGEETLTNIIKKIRAGSILDTYPIGTQIVIPYTDPVNNTTYDLPFNFSTVQTFQREYTNSTFTGLGTFTGIATFTGLGLVSEYGLPTRTMQFDAREAQNTDKNRGRYGNNRWMYSNLRQWLNKSGKNWYTAAHSKDAAPTTPDPANTTGFLDCLPSEFVDACITVKNSTKTASVDGGDYDTTYDKFFPLSMSQANMKYTDTSYGLNDESEGRYWEYWRTKQGGTDYWSGNSSSNGGLAANNARIIYNIENHASACNWCLRSANLTYSYDVWHVRTSGDVYSSHASAACQVAPACVIG